MVPKVFIYRVVAAAGVLIALGLALSRPDPMLEPDSWAYYYAAENFSHGRLVVSDELHRQQVAEARRKGGELGQYVRLDDGNWALEKAPGDALFLAPFHRLGVPWAAGLILALAAAAVTYLFLTRLRGELAACLGVLLIFFMPVSLIMLNRTYITMFSTTAFLVTGAGLYLSETLRGSDSSRSWVLFLAGLLMGWSVVSRYTNVLVVGLLVLHFVVSRSLMFRRGERRRAMAQSGALLLGTAISVAVLLWYNESVFGSPWDYGYRYTRLGIRFAFDNIGEVTPWGSSAAWEVVKGNLRNMPGALLLGFPVLAVGLPGMVWLACQKRPPAGGAGRPVAPRSIVWLLIGWFLAVYGLYFLYQWTSTPHMRNMHYMIVDRFYLPGLFPLAVAAALALSRISARLAVGIAAATVTLGSVLFTTWVNSDNPMGGPPQRPGITSAATPLPQVPPIPGQLPPAQSPQPLLSPQSIDQVRQEVRVAPTTADNIYLRLDVLRTWRAKLAAEGYGIQQALPVSRLETVEDGLRRGDLRRACGQVDELYRILETLVASGK